MVRQHSDLAAWLAAWLAAFLAAFLAVLPALFAPPGAHAAPAVPPPPAAQTTTPATPSAGVSILPATLLLPQVTHVPKALLPNFQPQGWLALVCATTGCALRPVALALSPNGASEPNAWAIQPGTCKPSARGEFTVVLLKGLAAPAGTPVPTWFTLRTPRRAEDAALGTLGVRIDGNGSAAGQRWHIVPRWNPVAEPRLLVHLESAGTRAQALSPIGLLALERGIGPKDLLVWAGDLDGDGRIDLITRTGPSTLSDVGANGGQPGLVLWLSSRAAAGEQVGLAGQLASWPEVDAMEPC